MTSLIKQITLLIAIFCTMEILAETNFYKLVSVERDKSVNIGGGQFVTFVGDRCFDSNKAGISVKNGFLEKNPYQSTSFKLVYSGVSYWGDCKYIFTNSKQNLKVITQNGAVYNYVKSMPSSGMQTCSLIKTKSRDCASERENGAPIYGNVGAYNNSSNNYTSGSNNSSERQNQRCFPNNNSTTNQRHTCPRCKGKKRIVYDTNPPMFVNNYKKRCDECGGIFWASTGHCHIPCPQCHGKGYF